VNAPVQYGPRAAALAAYLWHGQFLSRDRAAAALGEMFGCAPSPGVIAAMTAKVAGIIAPAIDAIVKALIAADVAHFDETGFRVAGKLAWVHRGRRDHPERRPPQQAAKKTARPGNPDARPRR